MRWFLDCMCLCFNPQWVVTRGKGPVFSYYTCLQGTVQTRVSMRPDPSKHPLSTRWRFFFFIIISVTVRDPDPKGCPLLGPCVCVGQEGCVVLGWGGVLAPDLGLRPMGGGGPLIRAKPRLSSTGAGRQWCGLWVCKPACTSGLSPAFLVADCGRLLHGAEDRAQEVRHLGARTGLLLLLAACVLRMRGLATTTSLVCEYGFEKHLYRHLPATRVVLDHL